MKKLLIMGCSVFTTELLKRAKEKGIFTIVTDNSPVDNSHIKNIADEAWDIDVKNVDEIVKRCLREGVTAVMAAASEFCTEYAMDVCDRLDIPFYCSRDTWNICADKDLFKVMCRKCGVPVADEYDLDKSFRTADLEKIKYPVIVKPVDSNASQGVHLCENEKELIEGYLDADSKSQQKKVIVEQYVPGTELVLIFSFSNGIPSLVCTSDVIYKKQEMIRPVIGAVPSRYRGLYEGTLKQPLEKLFREIHCEHGIGFVQVRVNESKTVILEMNYRLPGNKFPAVFGEKMCDAMIEYAVNRADIQEIEEDFAWNISTDSFYMLIARPGIITEISGLEQIAKEMPDIKIQTFYKKGDIVSEGIGFHQVFAMFEIHADSGDVVANTIDIINRKVKVKNENGEEMLYKYSYEL